MPTTATPSTSGFSLWRIVTLLCLLPSVADAVFIDNSVVGTPRVQCEDEDVSLDVITAKPFGGNVFVKGKAKDEACRQSYSSNSTNSYTLPLGQCGMQRLRSANPRGVSFSITVVVSFHPSGLITKNDRAFNVRCFYTEPDEIVTSSFEVSPLPMQELSDAISMPVCEYSVHSGGVDGPLLSYASVGDTIFHIWKCSGPHQMGILIKKCFVTDGDGEDHPIVDHNGCSLDESLLSEISYDTDAMKAYAQSQAFKYADSNQLYFTCQVRMCQKQMDMCEGITPPKCGASRNNGEPSLPSKNQNRRRRRNVVGRNTAGSLISSAETDLASPHLLILAREEKARLDAANWQCTREPTVALVTFILIIAPLVLCTVLLLLLVLFSSPRTLLRKMVSP